MIKELITQEIIACHGGVVMPVDRPDRPTKFLHTVGEDKVTVTYEDGHSVVVDCATAQKLSGSPASEFKIC